MNMLPSLWPGEVVSYDGDTRLCMVTVGDNPDPVEAIIMPSLGDRPIAGATKRQTEIEMLAGDLVWLMFECGDPRFPIIIGYRTPRAGNPTGWRRWHHDNIEMTAVGKFIVNCEEYIVNSKTTQVNAEDSATITAPTTTLNANAGATVNSPVTQMNGALAVDSHANGADGTVNIQGATLFTGTLRNNGANVGANHVHDDPQGGTVGFPH